VPPFLFWFYGSCFKICYLSQPATSFPIDKTKMTVPKSDIRFLSV
jgi:hypothetical protein